MSLQEKREKGQGTGWSQGNVMCSRKTHDRLCI